mmetsp:Transcript_38072/g.91517  ORF Transcript_38072/g.91517 Transcript_38072/m.91517 type:complete len:208 (+) Transcript_38072:394-1017(+)
MAHTLFTTCTMQPSSGNGSRQCWKRRWEFRRISWATSSPRLSGATSAALTRSLVESGFCKIEDRGALVKMSGQERATVLMWTKRLSDTHHVGLAPNHAMIPTCTEALWMSTPMRVLLLMMLLATLRCGWTPRSRVISSRGKLGIWRIGTGSTSKQDLLQLNCLCRTINLNLSSALCCSASVLTRPATLKTRQKLRPCLLIRTGRALS